MVPIMALWLPILLSAVFVFIISSIIHMVLKYHQNDFCDVILKGSLQLPALA